MAYVPTPMDTAWQRESGVDLGKTAVVVVDVLGGGEGTLPVLEDMAAWCVRIVRAARSKGVPVVFACDAHLPSIDRELELWGDHGIAGSEAARPLAAFEVRPGDYVVPKRRYDAFSRPTSISRCANWESTRLWSWGAIPTSASCTRLRARTSAGTAPSFPPRPRRRFSWETSKRGFRTSRGASIRAWCAVKRPWGFSRNLFPIEG